MNYIKNYLSECKIVIFILVYTFMLSIVNLVFSLSPLINALIGFLGIVSYSFVVGIRLGMKVTEKAYFKGLRKGLINVLILYILSLLFFSYSISLKRIIYYIVIVFSTILGSIIGINKKK